MDMRAMTIAAAVAAALAAAPAAYAQPTADNRAVATDFWRLVFAGRAPEAFDRYVSPAFIEHNPNLPDGPAGARAFLSRPEYMAGGRTIERMAVDGDLVFVHMRSVNPETQGVTAVVDIFRLQDGKIVEHWDVVQRAPETSRNPHPMF